MQPKSLYQKAKQNEKDANIWMGNRQKKKIWIAFRFF